MLLKEGKYEYSFIISIYIKVICNIRAIFDIRFFIMKDNMTLDSKHRFTISAKVTI